MTDKVQKIRAFLVGIADADGVSTILAKAIEKKILPYIDSLQEEPVSVWHDGNTLPINYEIEDILVVYNQYGREYLHLYWEDGIYSDAQGLSKYNWKYVEKWAYIKDLLKLDNPCNIGKNLQEPQVEELAETQHISGTCKNSGNSLTQEPVSEELEEASFDYAEACKYDGGEKLLCVEHFKSGAKWQKENLWKSAEGPDLPIINREVIALLDNGKVVFAHRPPEYWDGKNIITGKVTRNYPKTYDKGGWNIPNIKYWLDVELPKEIEL